MTAFLGCPTMEVRQMGFKETTIDCRSRYCTADVSIVEIVTGASARRKHQ